MSTDERRISLRVKITAEDGTAVMEMTGPAVPENGLQAFGDWVLAALDQHADGAAEAARRVVTALRERDWEGDDVLADQLDALLGSGAMPDLRPLPVDLDELVGILEGDFRIGGARDARDQRERAILELHHHALERCLDLVDRQLEELQDHRLIRAEELAAGDAEKEAITDLAGGAGDGNANGRLHGRLLQSVVARIDSRSGRAGDAPAAVSSGREPYAAARNVSILRTKPVGCQSIL